jgi:IS5 family transposase
VLTVGGNGERTRSLAPTAKSIVGSTVEIAGAEQGYPEPRTAFIGTTRARDASNDDMGSLSPDQLQDLHGWRSEARRELDRSDIRKEINRAEGIKRDLERLDDKTGREMERRRIHKREENDLFPEQ